MTGASSAGSEAVSWATQTPAVLPLVQIDRPDLTITVDPALPHNAFRVHAETREALFSHAHLFAGEGAVALAEHPTTVDSVRLAPSAIRLATTMAVAAMHLGELDEPLLTFDLAVARQLAGAPAAREFALGTAAAERLAATIEVSVTGGALATALVAALADIGSEASQELRAWALMQDLEHQAVAAEIELSLHHFADGREPATTLGTPGASDDIASQLADPRPLPPRLLRFSGPGDPDLTVRQEDDLIVITAPLRDEVIADSVEAQGLFAVVADSVTGALLAVAPLRFSHGLVRSELHLPGHPVHGLHCALIGAATDPSTIRLDPLGLLLIEVERHCRHAWTMHRRAGAILAAVNPWSPSAALDSARALSDTAHRSARDAAQTAVDLIRHELRRNRNEADRSELQAHTLRADALASLIDESPAFDGPAGPTITELAAEILH